MKHRFEARHSHSQFIPALHWPEPDHDPARPLLIGSPKNKRDMMTSIRSQLHKKSGAFTPTKPLSLSTDSLTFTTTHSLITYTPCSVQRSPSLSVLLHALLLVVSRLLLSYSLLWPVDTTRKSLTTMRGRKTCVQAKSNPGLSDS